MLPLRIRRCLLLLALLPQVAGAQLLVRTYDGSNNNLTSPSLGQAGNSFTRDTPAGYFDGIGTMDPGAANPRDISNAVAAQPASIPDPRKLSDFVWQWGQFLDHDLTLAGEGTVPEPAMIGVTNPSDPLFPIIPFDRNGFSGLSLIHI